MPTAVTPISSAKFASANTSSSPHNVDELVKPGQTTRRPEWLFWGLWLTYLGAPASLYFFRFNYHVLAITLIFVLNHAFIVLLVDKYAQQDRSLNQLSIIKRLIPSVFLTIGAGISIFLYSGQAVFWGSFTLLISALIYGFWAIFVGIMAARVLIRAVAGRHLFWAIFANALIFISAVILYQLIFIQPPPPPMFPPI